MAARAIGSGTISFGLVAIPVKLYSTVDSTKAVRFNYLSKDGSRLKQQYIRASDSQIVEREDRVQGYEFAKGQYVTFTADEIKAMHIESTNAIEIAEFIPLDQVERVYIEKVYYLGPDKGAARSYHLLKEALRETKRAALAKYAARGRSHLVLVRPFATDESSGLIMEQLKHEDELRSFDEVPLEPTQVERDELDLALSIIGQRVNEKFEPERFEDEVRTIMMERIQQKVDGQEIFTPPEEAAQAKIIDLMEALKASVGASDKRKPARRASKRAASGKATSKPRAKQAKTRAKPRTRSSG